MATTGLNLEYKYPADIIAQAIDFHAQFCLWAYLDPQAECDRGHEIAYRHCFSAIMLTIEKPGVDWLPVLQHQWMVASCLIDLVDGHFDNRRREVDQKREAQKQKRWTFRVAEQIRKWRMG